MDYLKKLVGIDSSKNCDKILEFLQAELSKNTVEIKIINKESRVLIAGINTELKDIEPVVLAGHIDTVTPNLTLYETNPYSLTIKDKRAYGLGTIDMKSFTAIILDNISEIKKLDIPIILALTTDEETSLKSIELMIENFKEMGIKPKVTIVGEPTSGLFSLTANACYEYSVAFYGKACHSSNINDGINAICACAKLVTFIENRQKNYNLTSNCGVVSGGEVVNKVPDFAELTFDIRSIFANDIDMFISDIEKYIDTIKKEYNGINIEFKNTLKIPAFNMLDNEKLQNISKETNIDIKPFIGGCEAGYYTNYCGDALIFGVGDLILAHKPNEYVVIEEYLSYSQKLMEVLRLITKYYF